MMNVSESTKNSADLYAKANDAFFDDDYDEALTLFNELVELEPTNAEFILKRYITFFSWSLPDNPY
jgi:suppressor of G2 allele of SKP1